LRCADHSKPSNADDSVPTSSARGADIGHAAAAAFFDPGTGKKCSASFFCSAVDSCNHKKKKKQHQRSNHAALAVSTQKIQRRWMAYLERDDANQDAKDEEDERDDEPDDAPNFARNSVVSTARRSEKAVTSAP
jgi:hypothetical protein